MFQTLTQNFVKVFDALKNRGTLTESQIDSAMRDIRVALLASDVSLPVVREFIDNVSKRAKGQEVIKSVSPAQMVVKIINDEMVKLLSVSEDEAQINLNANPPVNILIAGLQGSGKTTASAKLALKLKNANKKVLLVSLDTYRPAAQEQLAILGKSISVETLEIIKEEKAIDITKRALQASKINGFDVVIFDSAGRLHIDDEMISELSDVKKLTSPTETLLVVDSMIGQDAINVAKNFDEKLNISGSILSRIDGDSKGGAALSIHHVTKKPIKFLSTGEKLEDFEPFDAERIVSRILDMGDIVSLVEKAQDAIDQKEAEKTAAKIKKGKFDLEDYISQIKMIKKMGGLSGIMNMIPGISKISGKLQHLERGNKMLKQQEAIVFSMTKKEKRNPNLLNASRKKRIASGAGVEVQQVNVLLKQFKQISSMIKKTSGMDPKALARSGMGKLFS